MPPAEDIPHRDIALAGTTALHYLLHDDSAPRIERMLLDGNACPNVKAPRKDIARFDVDHPLLGGRPIHILVAHRSLRFQTARIVCHSCEAHLPSKSFFRLREGLIMTAPELTLTQVGRRFDQYQLMQAGIDLCARYFIDPDNGIKRRSQFLTTPAKLMQFLQNADDLRGRKNVIKIMPWILPNSGSPEETRVYMQFCLPFRMGGFALPFDKMNVDVRSRKLLRIADQKEYSVDLAHKKLNIGIEYDGKDSHQDRWKDMQRRNELKMLDWDIFPITRQTLYNPSKTIQFGLQMRDYLGLRDSRSSNWDAKFRELRSSIGLPTW